MSKSNETQKKITHDWRYMFSAQDLAQGKKIVENGNYSHFSYNDHQAQAYFGTGGAFRAIVINSPISYSIGWDKDWIDCTCSKASGRHSRRGGWGYDDYGYRIKNTCPHCAALLYLFEQKHGPWVFEETEEEKKARIAREEREKEEIRLRKLIEEENRRRETKKKVDGNISASVQKFFNRHAKDDPDAYFDLKAAAGKLRTTKYASDRAEQLLLKGKIEYSQPTLSYGPGGEQHILFKATVRDDVDPKESYSSELEFDREGLITHSCSCYYSNSYFFYSSKRSPKDSVCEHCLALMVKAADHIRLNNPGDATDKAAQLFLEAMGESSVLQIADHTENRRDKKKDVEISPLISIGDGTPKLSFKIGLTGSKKYLLKGLRELSFAIENEKEFTLGKNLYIDFTKHGFTEAADCWVPYLMQRVSDNKLVNNKLQARSFWRSSSSVALQNSELLEGAALDRFYEISENTECEWQNKKQGTSGYLKIGHKNLHMEVTSKPMKNSSGNVLGIEVDGKMPLLLKGSIGSYTLDDKALSRISKEEERALRPFEKASDASGMIHFTIGKGNLAEFYYRIVPEMLEQPYIDYNDLGKGDLEKILPPEAVFTFKIDAPTNALSCIVEAAYGNRVIRIPDPEKTKHYRDTVQEDRVLKSVSKYFPSFLREEKCYIAKNSEESVFRLLNEGVEELGRYGAVLGTDAFQRLKLRPVPQIKVGVSIKSGLLDLEVKTNDIAPDELISLLESYRTKKKYHRIKSGEYIPLTNNEELDALMDVAGGLDLSISELLEGKIKLPSYRALYLNKLLEEHDALASDRDKTYRTLIKNFQTIRDADYEVPETMEEVLRPYQTYGYKWLHTLQAAGFGGILADEMGLGKTIQAIALFCSWAEEGLEAPVLVVCPASLVYNWQEEINRFAPQLRVTTLTGSAAERKAYSKDLSAFDPASSAQVCVISYDLLRRDIELYDKILFQAVIIDEAQYIKNQKAAMTKAVKGLTAKYRYALTGTPIENRLAELWSIFDFLMPGFLYEYTTFNSRFETPIVKSKDSAVSERLRNMVRPFILRRLKKDVLKDLPEKLEEVRYAKLDPSQRKVYDAQVLKMKQMIGIGGRGKNRASGTPGSSGTQQDKMQIFAELVKLREICCDPSLLFEDYDGESAKRQACLDLIESAIEGGHKMLVFSQFTSMLEILEKDLNGKKIGYYKITGSTSKEDRLRLVHRFNDGDIPVFLISLKAGGTGLNLTGADVVIHYDPWWNLAVQNQATDRAHRIGQKNSVTVYRMIAKDTIEEKILALQEAKKDLAEEILSGEGRSIYTLSNEELLELLE